MTLSTLEQHVMLAIVAQHPGAYSVSIRGYIRDRAGYRPPVGSVHAAAHRLERKWLVKSRVGKKSAHRGGRRKVHYVATALGQDVLAESLRAIARLQRGATKGAVEGASE